MGFKEFLKLQETGTSTGDIAGFARPVMPMVRRFGPWGKEDPFFKKKKKKSLNEQKFSKLG